MRHIIITINQYQGTGVNAFEHRHNVGAHSLKLLVEGRLNLAECYALSLPYLSWKMVLIGDPLYRPFLQPPAVFQ